jgi:hypothetical protein
MKEKFSPKKIHTPHPYDVNPNPDIAAAAKNRKNIAKMDSRIEESYRRIQLMLAKKAEEAKKRKK